MLGQDGYRALASRSTSRRALDVREENVTVPVGSSFMLRPVASRVNRRSASADWGAAGPAAASVWTESLNGPRARAEPRLRRLPLLPSLQEAVWNSGFSGRSRWSWASERLSSAGRGSGRLAVLLTNANEVVSVDRLIDALWGARPPRAAANALQYHVSQLRKHLGNGETIITRESGYLIRVAPDELDLLRFERLLDEAEHAAPDRRARLSTRRCRPLAVRRSRISPTRTSRSPRSAACRKLRLAALERRLEADLALGRHAEVVPELGGLVREHPFRERLCATLMRALYGAGRQADALAVYRETRQLLVDELGIEPSAALQELERAILRQDPALASEAAVASPDRALLVMAEDEHRLDDLLAIAEPPRTYADTRIDPRSPRVGRPRPRGGECRAGRAALHARPARSVVPRSRLHRARGDLRPCSWRPSRMDLILVDASPELAAAGGWTNSSASSSSVLLATLPCFGWPHPRRRSDR